MGRRWLWFEIAINDPLETLNEKRKRNKKNTMNFVFEPEMRKMKSINGSRKIRETAVWRGIYTLLKQGKLINIILKSEWTFRNSINSVFYWFPFHVEVFHKQHGWNGLTHFRSVFSFCSCLFSSISEVFWCFQGL